jgi:hypothetical protein
MKRWLLTAALAAFFAFLLLSVYVRQAVLFLVGIGLGATLAAARFGFTTGWRQLVAERDPSGAAGQLLLLALAALLAMPLLAYYPEMQAALGPPSISLIVGAFVFGAAMQVADGCGSGTLYKAGLGFPLNMAILPFFALGSFLGSVHLQGWLSLGQLEPVGFVQSWGVTVALLLTGGLLLGLAALMRLWVGPGKVWFTKRWGWGAVLLALFATLNLVLAGQPWGVVYGFGLWAGKLVTAAGLFDPSGNAFWSQANQARHLGESVLLDVTSITNIGILAGALWVGMKKTPSANQNTSQDTAQDTSQPTLSTQQWAVGLLAGLVMGYSSRLAFGCNVGAMLSGISTGSLHGWIWLPLAFAGTLLGLKVRQAVFHDSRVG